MVYGQEAVVPTEFMVPSLLIATSIHLSEEESLKEHLQEIQGLKEQRFLAEFHQTIQKERQKAWRDRHIKCKKIEVRGKVLLYDSKFQNFPGKLQMHWLRPFHMIEIKDSGAVRLAQLDS